MTSPRVVFGIPTYNHAHQMERTMRSLLGQSFTDFRVVVCDDCSSDATRDMLSAFAAEDPRLVLEFNDVRHGYTANARKAMGIAGERFPRAEFFAWGSDHDLWHPDWLACMVRALDMKPEASAAWSWFHRIDENDKIVTSKPLVLGGGASDDPLERIRYSAHDLAAGTCIHGLFRRRVLDRIGGLRFVLVPDRLLLAEASVFGPFVQVPEYLWYRRYFGLVSRERQRRSSFPDGAPWYSFLPLTLQHAAVLYRDLVLRKIAEPELSRSQAFQAIKTYVGERRRRLNAREDRKEEVRRKKLHKKKKLEEKKRRAKEQASGKRSFRTGWKNLNKKVKRRLGLL
ncbi:MAG: glycosyltransferase family 2 protein [Rhodospirillum sp.]|nr:glycosyltransferase family 2 protein [Rhodospirillum sp.]MCF8488082.1 glycosyltransferase family 2 protein [Rhodospirillum sp.]MCF8499878.1 glycosyltransferase family 2 protein [Rhodospirillum sp.]